jgi:hypothetical protein
MAFSTLKKSGLPPVAHEGKPSTDRQTHKQTGGKKRVKKKGGIDDPNDGQAGYLQVLG